MHSEESLFIEDGSQKIHGDVDEYKMSFDHEHPEDDEHALNDSSIPKSVKYRVKKLENEVNILNHIYFIILREEV